MDDETCCWGCGQKRPVDAPGGLCPDCLLRAGLEGTGKHSHEVTVSFGPAFSSTFSRLAESLGGLPQVLLRDTDPPSDSGPIVRPASEEMPDLADRTMRLQLFGEVARGGMGAVFKARDPDLGRDVAVKVLLESHRNNPDLVRRFVEEAQIGGQLQHPGIVPIYELGAFADRRPFFAMKLVKGRTLSSLLAERPDPARDLPRFLSVFESVCQTMAYAHARGVIHRDLKPSNVMVGSFGEVQVMDWGLAKVLPRGGAADDAHAGIPGPGETVIATARSAVDSDRSQAGSILGTPSYMAPEQARGEVDRLDERCDVFALGSILCELLTGHPAFTGRSSGEVQRKAARGEVSEAYARLDLCGADTELTALAKSCLAPEPEDRPAHAGEVSDRVRAYQAGVQERLKLAEIARAQEAARAEEATKRARVERDRLRLTVALAASVLALVMLGGGAAAWLIQQRQARLAGAETTLSRIQAFRDRTLAEGADPARWGEVLAAADQALASLGDLAGSKPGRRLAALRAGIAEDQAQAARDQKLLGELASVRTSVAKISWELEPSLVDQRFARAFRRYQLDLNSMPIADAIVRIKSRPQTFVREVVTGLDHWMSFRHDLLGDPQHKQALPGLRRLIELARGLDPDPVRNRLRALLEESDLKAHRRTLGELAASPNVLEFGPSTALLLSRSLDEAGDSQAAAEILRASVIRYPGDLWTNFQLASLLGDSVRSEPARLDEAIRYYTAVRAIRPEMGWDLAALLARGGRGAEAETLLRELSREDPESLANLFSLWRILKDRHKDAEAHGIAERMLAPLRDQVARDHDDARAQWRLAFLSWITGDALRALASFREVARIEPQNAEIRREIGILLGSRRDLKGAIEAYRDALRIAPSAAAYHRELAALLGASGDYRGKVTELQQAIRLKAGRGQAAGTPGDDGQDDPQRPDLFNCSIDAYAAGLMIGLLAKISGFDSRDELSLGDTLAKLNDWAGAVSAYRDAAHHDPEDSRARHRLGQALEIVGKWDEAEAAFNEEIALLRREVGLNPGEPGPRQALGIALAARG